MITVTCTPSTSQPSRRFSICLRVAGLSTVAMYSLVSPDDGCSTCCAHCPAVAACCEQLWPTKCAEELDGAAAALLPAAAHNSNSEACDCEQIMCGSHAFTSAHRHW